MGVFDEELRVAWGQLDESRQQALWQRYYDARNLLTKVTQPLDGVDTATTTYGYDATGNRTFVTDGAQHTTWQTYQPWNLADRYQEPTTVAYPAVADRTWTTSYDGGGLPVKADEPGGVTVTRQFDELGRLTSETGAGPSVATATNTFGYDLAGRRTTTGTPTGNETYVYDDRGLIRTATGPAGNASFTYDGAGRMKTRSDTTGTATFDWYPRGLLQHSTDPLTGVQRTYTWDNAGRLATIGYGTGGPLRAYQFDDLGRLTDDTLTQANTTVTARFHYGYDDNSNLTSQDVTLPGNPAAGVSSYSYDQADRLQSWTKPDTTTVGYSYDKAGNRKTAGPTTFTYDERNRLTSSTDGTYTYTARGTRSTFTPTAGAPVTSVFDGLDRQTQTVGVTYTYDSLGRLATRNGVSFTYVAFETDPVNDGTTTYARSPSGDLLALRSGTTSVNAGQNRHGDLVDTFDTNGTITSSRLYDPYGVTIGSSGTAVGSVGYQSDWTDPTTGLVDMGARWYDTTTGTFTTRDTIFGQLRTPITLNRYTYANGSPLNFFDPDGRRAKTPYEHELDGCIKRRAGYPEAQAKCQRFAQIATTDELIVRTTTQIKSDTGIGFLAKTAGIKTIEALQGLGEAEIAFVKNTVSLAKAGSEAIANPIAAARKVRQAVQRDGWLATINKVNPVYALLEHGNAYITALKNGDARAAGHAAFDVAADVYMTGKVVESAATVAAHPVAAARSARTSISNTTAAVRDAATDTARRVGAARETLQARSGGLPRDAGQVSIGRGTTESGPSFYRGARPGEAPSFEPRANDFKVDAATGTVKPTHGVSVFDNPGSATSKGFVPHEVDVASVPPELQIIQRGADPAHFEIVPQVGADLTPAQYKELMCQIVCKS